MIPAEYLKSLEFDQLFKDLLEKYEIRPNGRRADQYRSLYVQKGPISTADGSAMVKIGNTAVITGVKSEISESCFFGSNKGIIIPNIHFAAGCSPLSRPGPPSEEVQTLTSAVDECLNTLEFVDLSLLVGEGFIVVLYLDITILNNDGNIWDSLWLSVMSALEDTLLPNIFIDAKTNIVQIAEQSFWPVKVNRKVRGITFLKDPIIVDPDAHESALRQMEQCSLLIDVNSRKVVYQCGTWSGNVDLKMFKAIIEEQINNISL